MDRLSYTAIHYLEIYIALENFILFALFYLSTWDHTQSVVACAFQIQKIKTQFHSLLNVTLSYSHATRGVLGGILFSWNWKFRSFSLLGGLEFDSSIRAPLSSTLLLAETDLSLLLNGLSVKTFDKACIQPCSMIVSLIYSLEPFVYKSLFALGNRVNMDALEPAVPGLNPPLPPEILAFSFFTRSERELWAQSHPFPAALWFWISSWVVLKV